MKTKIISSIKIVVLTLALTLGLSYLSVWTGPTANPPDSNIPAPVNVGASRQYKTGSLQVNTSVSAPDTNGLDVYQNLRVFMGNIIVGTTSAPGTIQIVDGNQATGKVLVSDVNGVGHWADATSGGGTGTLANWENVPLTDTSNFDKTCEYRFIGTVFTTSPDIGTAPYFYTSIVSPTAISFPSGGATAYIFSNKKTENNSGIGSIAQGHQPVTKLEKRCVAGGGSGGNNLSSDWYYVALGNGCSGTESALHDSSLGSSGYTVNDILCSQGTVTKKTNYALCALTQNAVSGGQCTIDNNVNGTWTLNIGLYNTSVAGGHCKMVCI